MEFENTLERKFENMLKKDFNEYERMFKSNSLNKIGIEYFKKICFELCDLKILSEYKINKSYRFYRNKKGK